MKYKFNGVEVDSERGSPNLGIPPGMSVPVYPGDVLEFKSVKLTMRYAGLFNMEYSTLISNRVEHSSLVQGDSKHHQVKNQKGNA